MRCGASNGKQVLDQFEERLASGAKAHSLFWVLNVRAEARTLPVEAERAAH